MKWTNKGHEYDEMYRQIEQKESFYLFGAGNRGQLFNKCFGGEVSIAGFIDNNKKLAGTQIDGIRCNTLSKIEIKPNQGIIITVDQFLLGEILEQLNSIGLVRGVNVFFIDEFISVYYLYKYGKVYFSTISFLPSTVCDLKCRHCLNFNPFAKEFYVRKLEDLKADIDLFFSCIDYIMVFHLSGGEPFLYKNVADVIEYINNNYGDRIGAFRMVTNGTVVPSDEVLDRVMKCDIEVKIDDYREAIPKEKDRYDELIAKFNERGIKNNTLKASGWIDLAPERTDYSDKSEEWLVAHRNACMQSWNELRDGKLYSCNYAAYATVAGIAGNQDPEEVFDLREYKKRLDDRVKAMNNQNSVSESEECVELVTADTCSSIREQSAKGKLNEDKNDSTEIMTCKKELIEFRLGYTTKGYTNFCKKCRGFTPENSEFVKPAVQVE